MDQVYEAALRRRDELAQELKNLDDFIGTYRRLALELHIESRNTEGTKSSPTSPALPVEKIDEPETTPVVKRRSRVTDNPKPEVVVAEAVTVIREKGEPMNRRAIWNALRDRGVVVNGADPIKALGTMLWRSGGDKLTSIEGRGYWPKDAPEPPPAGGPFFMSATGWPEKDN